MAPRLGLLREPFVVLDNLVNSVHHLERSVDNPELALTIAKRVRREATLVIQEIAKQRDNATVPGGHKQ